MIGVTLHEDVHMNALGPRKSKSEVHQLLLDALEERWRNYRTELKRCRTEFSNEGVHDLRVAARRVLALFQLLNSITPRPRYQKLIRISKDQLDEFDDLRDTQVILAEISEVLHELPQLQEFQKHLKSTEEKMQRNLRKKIRKFETSELTKRIRKIHVSIEAHGRDDIESQLMQAVDDSFLRTQQRLAQVDLARSATIHRVRIAFKSFRYMMEIIHPLLKDHPTGNLKRMNDYQSLMGEIQDNEVFMQTLADYSESVSFPDLEQVHRYYENRHAEVVSAFVEDMNQLHVFWRSAPDQLFPWEKSK